MCSPTGIECYKRVRVSAEKCLPCRGLYADIAIDTSDLRDVNKMKKVEKLIEKYELYKGGFSEDITYPKAIAGIDKILSSNFIYKEFQTSRKRQNFI